MFKKILATSLAILTLSASGTMVHGLELKERVKSPETLSLCKCLSDNVNKYINLIVTLYDAELKGRYHREYEHQLIINKVNESSIEILEEIDYFLQKCGNIKAKREQCFSNMIALVCVSATNLKSEVIGNPKIREIIEPVIEKKNFLFDKLSENNSRVAIESLDETIKIPLRRATTFMCFRSNNN